MWRVTVLASTTMLASSESRPSGQLSLPDTIEAGRVAATLSDWQTITYFMMILLAFQVVERIITGWQMRATMKQLTAAMDKLGEATQSRATDIKVQLALIQQLIGQLQTLIRP